MSKLSIIIPSRNEQFLLKTVNDIFAKAKGEIEICVVLDGGEWPNPDPLPDRDNLIVIRHSESKGTRAAINAGVAVASGEFILKSDGHCLFDDGFDEQLKADCKSNWVLVPRRKRLDAENWRIQDVGKPHIDYEYMSWHPVDFGGRGHNIKPWDERNADESLKRVFIDDLMCFQASCYFMRRDYFYALDLMDEATYGKTQNEGEEIAFKTWCSGGRVVINKNTWYAHLRKGSRYPRDYQFESADLDRGKSGVQRWLIDSAWKKQTLRFEHLIEKFWPLPGWPEDWKEILSNAKSNASTTNLRGGGDAAGVALPRVDEPRTASRELSAERSAVGDGRVPSNDLPVDALGYILHKFNLDRKADYSKVTMPIGLQINRRQIAELLCELGFTIGAEIGTAEGEYAETLCKANPTAKLYCVDPWEPYSDYRDYQKQETLDDLYGKAFARLVPYNVELIKRFSADAARLFDNESLDFVYIDANHKYEFVVADIAAWLPKIKSGGVIAGHDYSHPKGKQFGVIEAVTGWTAAYGIAPWFTCKGEYEAVGDRSHSWMWVKQ